MHAQRQLVSWYAKELAFMAKTFRTLLIRLPLYAGIDASACQLAKAPFSFSPFSPAVMVLNVMWVSRMLKNNFGVKSRGYAMQKPLTLLASPERRHGLANSLYIYRAF